MLAACAQQLAGLPALFVGVRCPIEEIMRRRNDGQPGREGTYAIGTADDPVPLPGQRRQTEVHSVGAYDLEADTSVADPGACARTVATRLRGGAAGPAVARPAGPGAP